VILDTHIVIWWALDRSTISARLSDLLENASEPHHVSVASLWEFEIKRAVGKMPNLDFAEAVDAMGLVYLPVEAADAITAGRLPLHHRDPFDRMIIAHALNHGQTIVTQDRIFSRYAVPVLTA
jgi:PIN domain nuclease of toxin-antitoxin system